MTNLSHHSSHRRLKNRILSALPCFFVGLASAVAVEQPAQADVVTIDPADDPEIILSAKEARRLKRLLGTTGMRLESDFSSDGRYLVMIDSESGWSFLDTQRRRRTKFSIAPADYNVLTEMRWNDSDSVQFIATNAEGQMVSVEVDRATGEATSSALALSEFPVSLSPDGGRVVVAEAVEVSRSSRRLSDNGGVPIIEIKEPGYDYAPHDTASLQTRRRQVAPVVEVRLSVLDLDSGEKETLLQVPENIAIGPWEWAPTSSRFGVVIGEREVFTRGGVVETDSPTVQDSQGKLSPVNNPFLSRNALEVFRIRDSGVKRRTIKPTDEGIFADVSWGPYGLQLVAKLRQASKPDGRVYPTYSNPNRSFFRMYTANGIPFRTIGEERLGSLFGGATYISPFEILVQAIDGQSTSMFRYDVWNQESHRLDFPTGNLGTARVSSVSDKAAFVYNSYKRPTEIYAIRLDNERRRPLTRLNRRARRTNAIQVHDVRFELSNGEVRTGHLIQPRGADFPPENDRIVVWQNGGPTAPMINRWGGSVETPFNLLPNFGISVLTVPLPGRDGFGADFLDGLADNSNFGVIDIDEQKEIVEQLIDLGYTSPEKIGIAGCSYGGYFASQSITRHPDLYAAANPQCSLLDLVHEYEDGYKGYISYLVGASFEDDPEPYFEKSPSEFADNVITPTLIFSGDQDFLPYQISEDFHDGIEAVGTPVDFYKFLGEGHGLGQANSQIVAAQAQLKWFRKYLKR